MELINATKMIAGYTMGMRPDGRELLVVVVKGTFGLPKSDRPAALAAEQLPLVEADVFTGEPGLSATLYESDYPPRKPRCDVLLNGSAYAPAGKAVSELSVELRVAGMSKSFKVVGNRCWRKQVLGVRATEPEPFAVMPLSYGNAFGGMDHSHADPQKHQAFRANPVGVGFHVNLAKEVIDGKPLPNTEEHGRPIREPAGDYRPMAFGPLARASQPRCSYAGTYDAQWLADGFPFLPSDFDDRYYQAAPDDQQVPHLVGGEEIELINLTPDGRRRFRLPELRVPVEFFRSAGGSEAVDAVLDTVLLEPDRNRFTLCWRASLPLRRNMFEISAGIVGRMPRGWYRARRLSKKYYRNLHELVLDRSSQQRAPT